MSGLKGEKVSDYLQQKSISKKTRQEVKRVAESETVTNQHVFVSIFG